MLEVVVFYISFSKGRWVAIIIAGETKVAKGVNGSGGGGDGLRLQ